MNSFGTNYLKPLIDLSNQKNIFIIFQSVIKVKKFKRKLFFLKNVNIKIIPHNY